MPELTKVDLPAKAIAAFGLHEFDCLECGAESGEFCEGRLAFQGAVHKVRYRDSAFWLSEHPADHGRARALAAFPRSAAEEADYITQAVKEATGGLGDASAAQVEMTVRQHREWLRAKARAERAERYLREMTAGLDGHLRGIFTGVVLALDAREDAARTAGAGGYPVKAQA